MRVLLITQIFLPEMGALANRMYPIVRRLVAEGHQVSVATGMPNYPGGVVFPEYQGKRFLREEREGYVVLRTAYFTTPRNQKKWLQLRSYLSFVRAAFLSGLRAGDCDVVFVTSPPIFPAIAGVLLTRLRGAILIFDIRDLWPDEIVACGAGREGSLQIRLIQKLERWVYRRADLITCTTHAFMETVIGRGVSPEKTLLIPNGADLEIFRPLPAENAQSARYAFGDRFVVMYSGLLGIKHGLTTILAAAEILRSEPKIVFFFLGSGAERKGLENQVRQKELTNVLFGEECRVEEVPFLLARANVCLSSLRPEPYLEKIISVKIFEYFACEKPVVIAQAGESARIVEESQGGIVVAPGDAKAMAEAIRRLFQDPDLCRKMGQKGRQYVSSRYSREVSAARLAKAIRLLGNSSRK